MTDSISSSVKELGDTTIAIEGIAMLNPPNIPSKVADQLMDVYKHLDGTMTDRSLAELPNIVRMHRPLLIGIDSDRGSVTIAFLHERFAQVTPHYDLMENKLTLKWTPANVPTNFKGIFAPEDAMDKSFWPDIFPSNAPGQIEANYFYEYSIFLDPTMKAVQIAKGSDVGVCFTIVKKTQFDEIAKSALSNPSFSLDDMSEDELFSLAPTQTFAPTTPTKLPSPYKSVLKKTTPKGKRSPKAGESPPKTRVSPPRRDSKSKGIKSPGGKNRFPPTTLKIQQRINKARGE